MKYLTRIFVLAVVPLVKSKTVQELNNAVNELREAILDNSTRVLTTEQMEIYSRYGCWCYFEEDHGYGKSQPVDDYDALCKTLHDGYECMILDDLIDVDSGEACVPWETQYNSTLLLTPDLDQLRTNCDANNVIGSCNNAACKVESWFITNFVNKQLNGITNDPTLLHANGFDVSTGCPIHAGTPGNKAGCGEYPTRFPFKHYEGLRACCQGKTYSTEAYQCCTDGSVKETC